MALALGLSASCGIPSDGEPRAIPEDELPGPLAGSGAVSTSQPAQDVEELAFIHVVQTDGDEQFLAAIPVPFEEPEDDSVEAGVRARLEALLAPLELGEAEGFSSSVPEDLELLEVSVDDGVATLTLSEELLDLEADRQRLAVAQIVFTATQDLPNVSEVQFVVNDELVEVPGPEGGSTAEVVSRSDYDDIRPRAS